MARYDFDMITIGAGSGGVASSRRAGSYGARVAIVEESRIGGTCVLRGCVPKKLLVYGAQFADAFEDSAGFGWSVAPPRFDWPSLIAAKDNELDRLEKIYVNMLRNSAVEIIEGRGVLVDPHTVEVTGRRYTAENILIATGGHPLAPDVPASSLSAGVILGSSSPASSVVSAARSPRSSGARSCCTGSTTICALRWRRRCATAVSKFIPAPTSCVSKKTRSRAIAYSRGSARKSRPIW
jgi:pyruvate/2-oxoglutarate dehydrogenase complex dihydrolipoamide dehydrogenase (E3) component